MAPGYISPALRRLVVQRAASKCEYCLYPQAFSLLSFEIEHIIAEKHGGSSDADNLALACPFCNRAKGSDLGSVDHETGKLTPFFNPRTQSWLEHFSLTGPRIVPLTPEGRVTVAILQINHPDRTKERRWLINARIYP